MGRTAHTRQEQGVCVLRAGARAAPLVRVAALHLAQDVVVAALQGVQRGHEEGREMGTGDAAAPPTPPSSRNPLHHTPTVGQLC